MQGSENESTSTVLAKKQKRDTFVASNPTGVIKDTLFIRLTIANHSHVRLTRY